VKNTVSWWFQQKSTDLMRALSSPDNGLVACGNLDSSPFVDAVSPSAPMGSQWKENERAALSQWIVAGCPIPPETPQPRLMLFSSDTTIKNHLVGKIKGIGARG